MWRNSHELNPSDLAYGIGKYEMADRLMRHGDYNWRVLDIQESRILVLSDKIIEPQPFHNKSEPVTWAESDLRRYLNETFLKTFSEAEKSRMIESKITTSNNPWFGTGGGSNTTDKVFLLSVNEVVKYFGDSRQLRNKNRNTKYFISDKFNYVRKTVDKDENFLCWWLRTPGNSSTFISSVTADGRIVVSGDFANRNNALSGGVRPAIWLKR
jgi:hypothetical protein